MQVNLAGFNIDASLIRQLNTHTATPEVISAAYARISRSKKSVTELRQEALKDLDKARRSNQNIVFELGHSSVAEHAVFNFDIIGISRLLTETLETVRLASFTEKSQRYVTFQNDYVLPQELEAAGNQDLLKGYTSLMEELFAEYQASIKAMVDFCKKKSPFLSAAELDNLAKENARYILPLSTKTQLGMTINARSLETLLKRLDGSPYLEARDLYAQLLKSVKDICPSLVRYTAQEDFTGSFLPSPALKTTDSFQHDEQVRVLSVTDDAEDLLLAALLYEQTGGDYASCREQLADLDYDGKNELWHQVFAGIKPWSKMHRAFELVDFVFELRMSESCWAQFKRHRMGTMLRQNHPGTKQLTIPGSVIVAGREAHWQTLWAKTAELENQLRSLTPDISGYVRTNADKVKVLVKMNLRELYHFVRLRSDEHAQWEINELSHTITDYLQVFCPHAAALLCGKSEFEQID